MITQVKIADALGLDVSSVNKILNGTPGHTFHRGTIAEVKKVARRLGWRPKCRTCPRLLNEVGIGHTFASGKRICTVCALIVYRECINAQRGVIGSGGVSPITVDLGGSTFPKVGKDRP